MVLVKNGDLSWPFFRIDTGDDRRISKDEFTSDTLKGILEKVTNNIKSDDDDDDNGDEERKVEKQAKGEEPISFLFYKCSRSLQEDQMTS